MNHYLFKYTIERSKELFLDKRVSSVSLYSHSSFTIEFTSCKHNLFVNLSPQNSFIFPTIYKLNANKINDAVFAVFLKKKLPGLMVKSIQQSNSERVAIFELEDKRGNIINRFHLIFEIMDRRSNAVFTDDKFEILQAFKHINSQRIIMPHKKYLPPPIDMPDLLNEDIDKLFLRVKHGENILGLNGTLKNTINTKEDLITLVSTIKQAFESKQFRFFVFSKKDIYPFAVNNTQKEVDEEYIFDYFMLKPRKLEFENRKLNLKKILQKRLKSLKRRLIKIDYELQNSIDADNYRIIAENLLSNPNLDIAYKQSITLKDLYTQQDITISLNPKMSLFDNAQNYFKKFKKAKKSKKIIQNRRQETQLEIAFIEQLTFDIESAQNEKDIESIKDIMIKESIIRANRNNQKQITYKPYERIKIGNFDAYIGKNAKGNDLVTLKLSNKNDLWFHPKERPGAHLILKNPNRLKNIDENVKILCAEEVAKKSKVKEGEKIDIDYTFIKFVKKPKGFKTGMVIYSNFKTLTVEKK